MSGVVIGCGCLQVYDTEGRFVPQKFEEVFSKYDRENKGETLACTFGLCAHMTQFPGVQCPTTARSTTMHGVAVRCRRTQPG